MFSTINPFCVKGFIKSTRLNYRALKVRMGAGFRQCGVDEATSWGGRIPHLSPWDRAPVPLQILPCNMPGQQQKMPQLRVPYYTYGRPRWRSRFLVSVWPRPGSCKHLGTRPVDEQSPSIYLSVFLSPPPVHLVTLPFKQKFFIYI